MRPARYWLCGFFAILFPAAIASRPAPGANILHSFAPGTADGHYGNGSFVAGGVTLVGSTLFGATGSGGAEGAGTIFSVDTDGSNYQLVHSFSEGVTGAGRSPLSYLTHSGSKLYGTTSYAGDGVGAIPGGSIFSLNADGTGFQTERIFGPVGVNNPWGPVTVIGNSLYTSTFGLSGESAPSIVGPTWIVPASVNFRSSMVASGGVLYGPLPSGIFAVNAADGSNFHTIGGWGSEWDLTLVGSTLYGVDDNFVRAINTDGSNPRILHLFSGGTNNGLDPAGGLTLVGGQVPMLVGTTRTGGAFNKGTVYKIGLDGTGFTLLHSFSGVDGQTPQGVLAFDGEWFYGTTVRGGANNLGTIFAVQIPEPSSWVLIGIGLMAFAAFAGRRRRRLKS